MNTALNHQQRGKLSKEKAQQRAQAGIYSAKPVLGYLRARPGEVHVPDPTRVPLIRLAFHLAAVENQSLRTILRTVNELGLTTNAGKPLSLNALHLMLTNPYYAGLVRNEDHLVPGKHNAIVSNTQFETAQKNLISRKR